MRQSHVPKLGPPPPATTASVSRCMKGNVRSDTKPELLLRRLLREAGFPGYRLHWKQAPGTPDIAYPSRKVAIFVNGCFWHRCPRCSPAMPKSHSDFWERKFIRNRERDARKVAQLEAAGWKTVTVWECELRDRTNEVVASLIAELASLPASPPRILPSVDLASAPAQVPSAESTRARRGS